MCNHQGAGKIDEESISGEDKHAVVSTIRAKRRLSRALGLGTPRHTMAENTRQEITNLLYSSLNQVTENKEDTPTLRHQRKEPPVFPEAGY